MSGGRGGRGEDCWRKERDMGERQMGEQREYDGRKGGEVMSPALYRQMKTVLLEAAMLCEEASSVAFAVPSTSLCCVNLFPKKTHFTYTPTKSSTLLD